MGTLLRFPYEVRDEKDYFEDIPNTKLGKDALDLAKHIVQTKSGHFHPETFEDHYEKALRDLIAKKKAGERIETPKTGAPAKVINLMDALRRSVQEQTKRPPAPSHSQRGKRPTRKPAKKLIDHDRLHHQAPALPPTPRM
jgi:DNA end-binding protein Ku